MSRRGNCYDNAVMESWFSTVKNELGEHFDSCGEAKRELFDYIEVFYNQRRRHSTLGYLSPAAFERQATVGAPPVAIAPEIVAREGVVQPAQPGDRGSWSFL